MSLILLLPKCPRLTTSSGLAFGVGGTIQRLKFISSSLQSPHKTSQQLSEHAVRNQAAQISTRAQELDVCTQTLNTGNEMTMCYDNMIIRYVTGASVFYTSVLEVFEEERITDRIFGCNMETGNKAPPAALLTWLAEPAIPSALQSDTKKYGEALIHLRE
ncbi:hypothetical protein Anapl_13018 [Anas platyrhynchos]|uniref:Uncharacterized protein n=1 Tax=Anas platyrhynchos TaxID=8839 RepID=R0JRT2_ANAPL|nr:hypothetical protein Anapl_13018 [Anas platyrhynchos]